MRLRGRSLAGAFALMAAATAVAFGQSTEDVQSCSPVILERFDRLAANIDATIASCTRLIDAGGTGGRALFWPLLVRAAAYGAKHDYKLLIADLTKAIEIEPLNNVLYTMRGSAYLMTAEIDHAIADFTRVIDLTGLGHGRRADAYSRKGEHERAIADATKEIETGEARRARAPAGSRAASLPANPDDYARRARIYLRAGNPAQALVDVERALELSQALQSLRADDGGEKVQRRKAEAERRHAGLLHARAQVLEALGRREDAISDYRRALRLAPDDKGYQEALRLLGVEP